ncbi:hypothetical protein OEZ78_27625, partial [Leclercia adecarboxylata]|uniref:hypothetical protein n=1 Tax=Leclercia adecarboxylata TaxID=83655 RepID=UPI00234C3207
VIKESVVRLVISALSHDKVVSDGRETDVAFIKASMCRFPGTRIGSFARTSRLETKKSNAKTIYCLINDPQNTKNHHFC